MKTSLEAFQQAVHARIESAFASPSLDPDQSRWLQAVFAPYVARCRQAPGGDPLALYWYVARAWRDSLNERDEALAAFGILYILALDLFDDVQDDDLRGKPTEAAGMAISLNTALTLSFLSLDELRKAMASDLEHGMGYLEIFNHVSLLAVSGQHRDLLGEAGAMTPEEVLAMQQAKTSSLAMIVETAALASDCDAATRERYRRAAEQMVLMVQVIDDLRDLFGKPFSPDLATGKRTYPLACYYAEADPAQAADLKRLMAGLPGTMKEIRTVLYGSGAVMRSAERVETLRRGIHEAIAETQNASPAHRMWLHLVDSLAATLYRVPTLEVSRRILEPDGPWHGRVRALRDDLLKQLAPYHPPEAPRLLPWHLPQWMYSPEQGVIFYSDLEGQGDEIVSRQARLLKVSDHALLRAMLEDQAPLVLAHEFFHFWRHQVGCLTSDMWYEEWVANRLALAFYREHHPDLISRTAEIVARLQPDPETLSPEARRVLERLQGAPHPSEATGYEVSLEDMARIQLLMVRQLLDDPIPFSLAAQSLLHARCPADEMETTSTRSMRQ